MDKYILTVLFQSLVTFFIIFKIGRWLFSFTVKYVHSIILKAEIQCKKERLFTIINTLLHVLKYLYINVCMLACAYVSMSPQSFLTLCDPKDCSLPGSSVHGIFQARICKNTETKIYFYKIKSYFIQYCDCLLIVKVGSHLC